MADVNVIPRAEKAGDGPIPVCVYARVSTQAENQKDSLENQIEHYTEAIGNDPRYSLVGIYHDFGISGFKESRPGFQQMMEDAERGKFQMVITKSISRFARNTRTILDSTRHLKSLGIGVYFELQGIDTLSSAGELMLSLYSTFAEAESQGARQHTLMALKKKFDEGSPPRRLEKSMGYLKGEDGEFYVDPQFAPYVIEMYEMAAEGYSAAQITNYFNLIGRTNHNGKAFDRSSVTRLLRNPAYKGDFIAQRYYVDEDRKLQKNNGEKAMLYIEEDHVPIVTADLWQKAQEGLDEAGRRRRKESSGTSEAMELNDENYPYRHDLFCCSCGHRLNRAVRAGRVLWECNGKTRFGKDFCAGTCVTDEEVRSWKDSSWEFGSPIYVYDVMDKGVVKSHSYLSYEEWSKGHVKKTHVAPVPELTEENYPYMGRIFCRYCASRLRRIVSNAGKVSWICDGSSRQGKAFCKGIRVPDEKLKPLAKLEGKFYIGKEVVDGKESYGYSRKPEGKG